MGYRVQIGAVVIECDSPEEALEIARRAEVEGIPPPTRSNATVERGANGGSRWSEKRATDLFRLIDGRQRKLLDALMEHLDGQTDGQLLQLLGLNDGRQLAGVFTGLWKNAKKVGADPNDLYVKRPATIGGKRVYEYFLSESFRKVAAKTAGKT